MKRCQIYYSESCDLSLILGKSVGIIGYGNQGRATALNLRDLGIHVQVACSKERRSYSQVVEDGFIPASVGETVQACDVLFLLTSDDVMAEVFKHDVEPYLRPGHFVGVAHGLNFHYGKIKIPDGVHLFLIAPKGPGKAVRENFVADKGMPALVALWEEENEACLALALSYAKAMKFSEAGVLRTSFREETETDLFGEQAVLCGGLSELIRAAFETLVDNGYSQEMAYLECLHETKLIADLLLESGMNGMFQRISKTALFGSAVAGTEVIGPQVREAMQGVLTRIRNRAFVDDFLDESKRERILKEHRERWNGHLLETTGAKIRKDLKIGG